MQKKSKIWKVSTDLTAVEVAEGIKCLPPKQDDWSEKMVTSCNPSSREQTQNPQGKLASQTRWNWWAPGSARDSVSINNCKVTGKNKQTNITLTSTIASTCTCTHTIASTKKGIKTKGPVQYKNKGVKALITSPDGLSSVPRTHVVEKEKISRKLSSNFSMLPVLHPYAYTYTHTQNKCISTFKRNTN